MKLSESDVNEMIIRHGFYERDRNPGGNGFYHQYKLQEIKRDKVVLDEATGLIWQQSGSDSNMIFKNVEKWITKLNRKRFAGFSDWRLPTLEEAMSLMEPKKNNERYINPIFDSKQYWIFTADEVQGESGAWILYLYDGSCFNLFYLPLYVRAVRSRQTAKSG